MRFITGVIFGIVLTFGAAFMVDSLHSGPDPDGRQARRMVNWDVVGDDMRGVSAGVQTFWARLKGDAKQIDRQVDRRNDN